MLKDPVTQEVRQITLSYTFFIDAEATKAIREQRAQARNVGGKDGAGGQASRDMGIDELVPRG
jgi:hypothetical protein